MVRRNSPAYNTVGQVISKTDQAGRITRFEYEAQRGNIAKVIDALNGTTTFTYDQLGNLLTQTDANNHTTGYSTTQWAGGRNEHCRLACSRRSPTTTRQADGPH